MADTVAGSDRMQSSRCSKPGNRVRIVGKIRGFKDQESESERKPWITVQKPQENRPFDKVTVSLDTQSTGRKISYDLDYCYEPDEDIGLIYSREIRHMISEVFNGQNACVIALGARGSGKTFTMQGSMEKPGLATMSISEILSKASEIKKTVSVSLYEITQDHAFDLLDPDYAEVQVLGDTQGKLNLKGLSRVMVKSVSEFQNMYFRHLNLQKSQKKSTDPHHYHRGLMVHISSEDDNKIPKLENKINFVDLAGYEDPRKSSGDRTTLVENYRSNKSLFALINVVNALKSNEIRVPYRESKLTRVLQDSLTATSHVLVLACLNPFFCKDSISSLSFVSRSSQSIKQVLTDSTNKCRSFAKSNSKVFSSLKSGKSTSTSLIVKKQIDRSQILSGKKAKCILSGRKLFAEENTNNPKQLMYLSEDTLSHNHKILQDHAMAVTTYSLQEENVLPCGLDNEAMIPEEKDLFTHDLNSQETINDSCDGNALVLFEDGKPCERNNDLNYDGSVPLSQKIKELSKNLKLLCSSTPMKVKMLEKETDSFNSQLSCNDTTPMTKFDCTTNCSPGGGTFSICGSSLKDSLVKNQLKFLNSANKEELKKLRGIGEKRASYILQLRDESPEPFKILDDLQNIGMSAKQIKNMMKGMAAELFN